MKSIQGRLALSWGLILLVSGVLLINASVWLLDAGLRRYLVTGLKADAQSLLAALERAEPGLRLQEPSLSARYQQPLSGHYFTIEAGTQQFRSRSLWDWQLATPSVNGLQKDLVIGPEEQELLLYRLEGRRAGQDLIITTAQDYQPLSAAFTQVRWTLTGLWALALIMMLLLQNLVLRASFAPLRQAKQQIKQLQQGRRSRLDMPSVRELAALIEQINRLLEHTEQRLQRTRTALGNLGHALKTPLAVLRSQLAREPLDIAIMAEQLTQIEQRLGRELNQARLAGEVLPVAYFNPEQELPALCATIQLLHPRIQQLNWHMSPGLRLPYEREDVLEVLGNLLDNAGKWAREQIDLRLEVRGDRVLIVVEDDGPGIAPELREQSLNRGMRLDEQVQGHGLGLAIVRDTVEAWQGRLQLERAALGGLRVVLELPLKLHASRVE